MAAAFSDFNLGRGRRLHACFKLAICGQAVPRVGHAILALGRVGIGKDVRAALDEGRGRIVIPCTGGFMAFIRGHTSRDTCKRGILNFRPFSGGAILCIQRDILDLVICCIVRPFTTYDLVRSLCIVNVGRIVAVSIDGPDCIDRDVAVFERDAISNRRECLTSLIYLSVRILERPAHQINFLVIYRSMRRLICFVFQLNTLASLVASRGRGNHAIDTVGVVGEGVGFGVAILNGDNVAVSDDLLLVVLAGDFLQFERQCMRFVIIRNICVLACCLDNAKFILNAISECWFLHEREVIRTVFRDFNSTLIARCRGFLCCCRAGLRDSHLKGFCGSQLFLHGHVELLLDEVSEGNLRLLRGPLCDQLDILTVERDCITGFVSRIAARGFPALKGIARAGRNLRRNCRARDEILAGLRHVRNRIVVHAVIIGHAITLYSRGTDLNGRLAVLVQNLCVSIIGRARSCVAASRIFADFEFNDQLFAIRCLRIASFIVAAPVVFKAEARDANRTISCSNVCRRVGFSTKLVLSTFDAFKRCSLNCYIRCIASKREAGSDKVLHRCLLIQIGSRNILNLVADLLEDIVQRGRVRRGEIITGIFILCAGILLNARRARVVRRDQMHETVGVLGLLCVAQIIIIIILDVIWNRQIALCTCKDADCEYRRVIGFLRSIRSIDCTIRGVDACGLPVTVQTRCAVGEYDHNTVALCALRDGIIVENLICFLDAAIDKRAAICPQATDRVLDFTHIVGIGHIFEAVGIVSRLG